VVDQQLAQVNYLEAPIIFQVAVAVALYLAAQEAQEDLVGCIYCTTTISFLGFR
jgi:uncharacterized membrane protein